MSHKEIDEESFTIEDKLVVLVKFVWEKRKFTSIVYFVSLLLAFAFLQFSPKQYKSSMIGFSNYLKADQVKLVIADLQLLLKSQKMHQVADTLGLSQSEISSLIHIEVLDQSEVFKKISSNDSCFQINAIVTDMKVLDSLDLALKRYISNNNYVKKEINSNYSEYLNKRALYKREICYVDSAKELLLRKLVSSENKGFVVSNLGEIIKTKIELNDKLNIIENKLKHLDGFQVIKSFDKSCNKSFPKAIIVFPIVFLLTSICLYLYFSIIKFSRNIRKNVHSI